MELRAGGCAVASLLLLIFYSRAVVSQQDSTIMDNDESRKLLGSSVVTSVSVIMEHGNGSKTVIKDGGGNAVKPQIVGTPGSFLSPDRYEFYSLDDSGDLVKRLMSLEEIQSLIAASRPELAAPSIPVYYHRPLVEPDIADEGVQNVLANVQSVLREELAKEREPPKPQPLPIDDSWSLLLPGLFGADLDFKQEPMLSKPIKPTVSVPEIITTIPSTTSQRPTYPDVPQGTTFDVLPPVTHTHTTSKPQESPTTKPVKYSAHYTTVKMPALIEKLPDSTVPPISPSTKPPTPSTSTNRPSTIIHYLPIQSISPSNHQSQKPISKPDKNKYESTTQPPKKTTPVKTHMKTTTVKPQQEFNYNKTYQRITVKPSTSLRPTDQTTKPVKNTVRPTTINVPSKPMSTLPSTTPFTTTLKPATKPYIRSTQKPELKPFTEFQMVETVPTRRPTTSASNNAVKRPLPTKGSTPHSTANKNHGTKTSSSVHKPQYTGKPSTYPVTEKLPPQKYSKPTSSQISNTTFTTKTTTRPSSTPSKVSSISSSTKPVKATPSTPVKTTILSTKLTSKYQTKPTVTTPISVSTNAPSTKLPSSATNNLVETIELVPITQDDELMASSAAALIQDLLRTETNPSHFTKPTSFSTMSDIITSSSVPVSGSTSTTSTTIKTNRPTVPTKITTTKPHFHVTKPTLKINSTSDKITTADKITTITYTKYNSTKKPLTTLPKPVSQSTYKPSSKKPQTQPTKKPVMTTVQPTRPYTNAVTENLSAIKSEALTQTQESIKNVSSISTNIKKPTEITVIQLNDLKKYASLNQLISARPDIVSSKSTTKMPPTTSSMIISTTEPLTTKLTETVPISTTTKFTETVPISTTTKFTETVPISTTTKFTETVPISTTVISTSAYGETDSVPSNDYINSEMIYKVISTLQSNPNKITYPTTMGDYLTSTMRTYPTESSTNVLSSESTTNSANSESRTDSTTESIASSQKISEIDELKLEPTNEINKLTTHNVDVELIRNFTMTTIPEYVTSSIFSTDKKRPVTQTNLKYQDKGATRIEEKDMTSTPVYAELLVTEASTPYVDESSSIMTTNFVDATTENINQDTSTNIFVDEAIQKGISAVANILLDDPNLMRRLGKPDKVAVDLLSTTYTSVEESTSTTTEGHETTTDLNLLRIEMGTDSYDLPESTTADSIIGTTEGLLPSTTMDLKMEEIVKVDAMLNDAEPTTPKVTTTISSTTKAPVKIPMKIKPSMLPTKESKLDDSMISEVNKLMATQKPYVQSTWKPNATSSDKLNKISTNKPNKISPVKPVRVPTDNPTKSQFKPNKILFVNKTSVANKTSSTNSTNQVKVELKNNNDKFFKKPGINSYQPNMQPPAAIELHPAPQESLGLEASTAFLQEDIKKFSDLLNEIGFRLWSSISGKGGISSRSFVLSPFAATSMLAMVFLGARGPTSGQMNDVLRLDDMVTFNPHQVLKNVTESVINSKNVGVATASFVRELYSDKFKGKILDFYKERVHQYYDGHVEEVNFNAIGDIVRRRTNLLVKRQTLGKLPEYLRGSSLNMRAPLAAFTANIFQSDCDAASTEGRDGEMYFVVRPSTRQRRLVPVPAVVWRSSFLAGYEPSLDATSVCLGSDSTVSTILVLPGQQGQVAPGDGLARLEQRLIETSFRRGGWSKLLRSLLPRPGLELQLPRFSHRSVLNITQALRHMGLKDLFTSRADLRGLNGVSNDLHLSDMVQVNTFSTCGEDKVGARHHTETYPSSAIRIGRSHGTKEKTRRQRQVQGQGTVMIRRQRQAKITDDWLPLTRRKRSLDVESKREELNFDEDQHLDENVQSVLSPSKEARASLLDDVLAEGISYSKARESKQHRLTDAPRLRFDRPFLYMIRHNPTGIILHMGRFNPRLLP